MRRCRRDVFDRWPLVECDVFVRSAARMTVDSILGPSLVTRMKASPPLRVWPRLTVPSSTRPVGSRASHRRAMGRAYPAN